MTDAGTELQTAHRKEHFAKSVRKLLSQPPAFGTEATPLRASTLVDYQLRRRRRVTAGAVNRRRQRSLNIHRSVVHSSIGDSGDASRRDGAREKNVRKRTAALIERKATAAAGAPSR